MSTLDNLKYKKPSNTIYTEGEKASRIVFYDDSDEIRVDFYDMKADFGQFYDNTRLIVKKPPVIIEDQKVYNCFVSWYGEFDCQIINKETGELESPSASDYTNVLMQIDLNSLKTNPDYCHMVMQGLLNRNRVSQYIQDGLKENPKNPCGNYIGGIVKTPAGFHKAFSRSVGEAVHKSPTMKIIRNLALKRNVATSPSTPTNNGTSR